MSSQLEIGSLLPEILGFHPQRLLDDLINAANEPIYQCTDHVLNFMSAWAKERAENISKEEQEDLAREIEEGLVAFQTLLESHVDLAFDYFEVWTLRNIFFIPPELQVTVPHQRGLDLNQDPSREAELFKEIGELREQLRNKRRLNRLLKSALPISNAQLARARARSDSISFLPSRPPSPSLAETLSKLTSSLPDPVPPEVESLIPPALQQQDPTKRPWEQGRTGYVQWAVSRLIQRTNGDDIDKDTEIDNAQREVFGDAEDLWNLHGSLEAEKASRPRDLELADIKSDSKKRKLE
ncbi:hypothetical protein Clacol_008385 [Clathrus columnatus]|uniref:Uncharacterized protein n=1 Tax=Clathrus columnatus TaxID=1419009 RepID=A0AAV5AN74_9AGAM|nr:hypothetical protein Clacol_008385 [Clathrus columnatus]